MTELAEVVAGVRQSKRYRHVSEELIRRIGQAELRTTADRRAALKAVKRKVHQVVGAFGPEPPYGRLLKALTAAHALGDPDALESACQETLRWHASTRERIPILPDLYSRVFALTGPPRTVADVGCGLSPLALPWMRLPEGAAYHAYDVDEGAVDFVNSFLALVGMEPLAQAQDVVARLPAQPADVAFLLKMLPTLEQQEEGCGPRLLDALRAPFVVVSFPVRSLGGRDKGMVRNYERQLAGALAGRRWEAERLLFETELVYVVRKETA